MRTYEKYKDSGISWIGKVPDDWNVCKFKYTINIRNGKDYKDVQSDSNNDYPVYGSGGIFAYAKKYLYDGEALLLGRKGTIDKPIYIQKGKFWTVDTMFYGLATNGNVCKFLYYQALTFPYGRYATSTALPSMTQSDLGNNPICLPSIPEQEAIANYLDKKTAEIDKIIAEREKKIELLNELKSSIISRAVTKGINPHAKMKDSGIDWFPFIPCNWEYSSLRHVCKKITDGSHFSPMSQLEGKPYITVTNVRNNKVYVEEALKISDEDFRTLVSTGCQPLPGDILLSKDGTVGRTAIVTSNDYVVLSSLGILRPSSLVDSKYLEYCLNSNALQMQMQMMMDGSALRRITIKKICNLLVLIPPMHEQLSIVKYLDKKIAEVNNSISTIRKECALYKEYKQSLISEVVTGKRKVID